MAEGRGAEEPEGEEGEGTKVGGSLSSAVIHLFLLPFGFIRGGKV